MPRVAEARVLQNPRTYREDADMPTTNLRNTTRASDRPNPRYLLRLTLPKADWDDAWEVCRSIEQCGGHRSSFGFAFCSAGERAEALEILRERFGARYFESLDVQSEAEAVRILVASPYEGRRHNCCAGLAKYGFRVAEAESGLECLEALRQQPPDILVLHRELLWGGSDGVLNMMQQDIAWSTIPVVLLGHREREDELPTCPSTPVIACLESPVAPSVLLATIQKFIRGAA
jgi:CheY-like chemotaxis protein